MARDGSGVYSPPAGTLATSGTAIESAKYNAFVNDLTADANAARPIVAGGTGATTAAAARTALGVQASSTALTSIAALTTAADRMIYTTAADTYAVATLTAAGRALLDDADAAAQLTTLGIGGDIPAVEALSGTGLAARTAANTWALRTITAGSGISITNGDGVAGNPTISAGWTYTSPVTLSGTDDDFTGIPSNVTEVRLFLNGTSLNGAENYGFQLGTSGGFVTSGYVSSSGTIDNVNAAAVGSTSEFVMLGNTASDLMYGFVTFAKGDGDDWFYSGSVRRASTKASYAGGYVPLGGTLTQIRIKSASVATFDAGTAYIAYR